jgi:hypothetical protein
MGPISRSEGSKVEQQGLDLSLVQTPQASISMTRSLAEATGIGTGSSRRLAGPYSTTAVMVFSLITGEGRG